MGRPLQPVSRIPWKLYGSGKNIEVAHTFQLSTPTGISSFFPRIYPDVHRRSGRGGGEGASAIIIIANCRKNLRMFVGSQTLQSLVSRILPRGTISSPTRRNLLLPSRYENLESLQFFFFFGNSPLLSRGNSNVTV